MSQEGKTQYLRIIGRLYPDNRIELRPGYLTTKPHGAKEDPRSRLVAELLDDENEPLLRYHLQTRRYCVDERRFPNLAVRGEIPFPSETKTVRFMLDDIAIHKITVDRHKPEIRMKWEPPKSVDGKQLITWDSSYAGQGSLQFFLRFTHNGKTWQRVGWRTNETKQEINFDELPGGGSCQVAVVATDGVNTEIAKSKTFRVPLKPCQAIILAPEDGGEFVVGEPIIFHGQGYYLEEKKAERESLEWESSKDGKIGRGTRLETRDLSQGSHQITLSAGKGRRRGTAKVAVRVRGKSKAQN